MLSDTMANTPPLVIILLFFSVFTAAEQTFQLIAKTMKQSDARAACRESYTDLVTVCSVEENAALTNLTNLTNLAWIGLQRSQFSSKWSNGDEVTFEALTGSCETGPCCAAMKNDGLWDISTLCKETRNFMCYKQDQTDLTFSYHLITDQSLNWYEAQSYCRKIYTDLISIRDREQNEAVKIAGVKSSDSFWIGLLHDDWEWADGGRSAYRNWGTRQPRSSSSSSSPDCTELSNGKWNSVICNKDVPAALCYNTSTKVSDDSVGGMRSPNYCKKVFSPRERRNRLTTFHLIEKNLTQSEAQAACRENYTHLVTVYNDEDITALTNLTGIGSAWTGLYRNHFSDKWSNGDDVTFRDVETGNCGSEPCCCTIKADGSWDYIKCTEIRNFMCYKQDQTDLTLSYHLITNQSLNWYEAQRYCRKIYTDLVSIRDQEQNEAVKTAGMKSSDSFWIGLLRDNWEWADGGRSAYRNWWAGHPKLSSADCVKLVSGKMYSVPCSNTGSALCYSTSLHVSDDHMNWENALDYCKQGNRTGLLHILTESDHTGVKNELRKRGVPDTFLWVGLGQSRLFGFWFWSDGSGLGPWTNWVGGEIPKPPLSQHCGAIDTKQDFKWIDKNCENKFKALCAVK